MKKQLCVWLGTTLGNSTAKEFEDWFKELGFTVKFSEETKLNNSEVSALIFWVNEASQFATRRFSIADGICWYETIKTKLPISIREKYEKN